MILPLSRCPGAAAAAALAVLPPLSIPTVDEVEVEKPGLTPPPCAAEPDRRRVTRGDRRIPAVGIDAGDADEDGASPSGGSLRLLLVLLGLVFIAPRFVRFVRNGLLPLLDEEVRWIVHYVRTECSTVYGF